MARLQAVLTLLKSATAGSLTTADDSCGDSNSVIAKDAIDVMFYCVIRTRCRRQDITGALAEIAEMDGTPGRPPVDAKVFLSLLEACAVARPPLLLEVEAVWVHAKVRDGGVGRRWWRWRWQQRGGGGGSVSVEDGFVGCGLLLRISVVMSETA